MGIVMDKYVVGPLRAPKIVNWKTCVVVDIAGMDRVMPPKAIDGPETKVSEVMVSIPRV